MIRSRSFIVSAALPFVLALAGLAGCNQPTAGEEATEVAESDVVAEPGKQAGSQAPAKSRAGRPGRMHGDHHRPHGPAMLLGAALHELDLTDAQKSTLQAEIDALRADAPKPSDDAAHRAAVAAAVRSGKIDEAALLAGFEAPKPPDTARVAKAVKVLHDTLSAAQRKELVDAMSAHMDRGPKGPHAPDMDAEDDDDDDSRPARPARGEGRGPEHAGRGPSFGHKGPLGHLLRDLDLTDAQREKVREAMKAQAPSEADREAMKARHEAFRATMRARLATFASDSFDANAFVAPPEGGAKPGPEKMAQHMIKTLAAVVPILDQGQREKLAARIEQGPPHAR